MFARVNIFDFLFVFVYKFIINATFVTNIEHQANTLVTTTSCEEHVNIMQKFTINHIKVSCKQKHFDGTSYAYTTIETQI